MSAQSLLLNGTDFTVDDVVIGKPRANKAGGKSVPILAKESGQALLVTTPLLLTWGANENSDDQSGRKWYDMSLQFPKDGYETENTRKFLSNMQALEEHIKNAACTTHCKDWFNKANVERVVVDALYTPMLRYPRDPATGEADLTRSPTIRVKLDYWDDKFTCELYDPNNQLLFPVDGGPSPVDLITKGSQVATILKCGGVWLANGKFGVTWRLEQAVVQPRPTIRGRCHISLSATDRTTMEAAAVPAASALTESDDEDETPEAELEPPPAPAPAPATKKKVVRRKAA